MIKDNLSTVSEVADRLSISTRTLRTWTKKGLIRSTVLGPRTIRYSEEQIEEYLASPLTVKIEGANSND